MMILWRVNRIRDPSEHEKELALEENSESDFIMVPYPTYEKETGKLLVLPRRWDKLSVEIPMTDSSITDLVEMKSLSGQDIEEIR